MSRVEGGVVESRYSYFIVVARDEKHWKYLEVALISETKRKVRNGSNF